MYYIKTNLEEEFSAEAKRAFNLVGRPLAAALRAGKRIHIEGLENRIVSGPNLILSSHVHDWMDVASLFKAYSKGGKGQRQLIFTPNKDIYDAVTFRPMVDGYIENKLDEKPILKLMSKLIAPPFTKLVSSSIRKIESVPFDLKNKRNNIRAKDKLKNLLWEYERAVAIMEFYEVAESLEGKPSFNVSKGSIKMPYEMLDEHGMDNCPITMFATRVEGKNVFINIGKPEYISKFCFDENGERKQRKQILGEAEDYLENKLERLYHGDKV